MTAQHFLCVFSLLSQGGLDFQYKIIIKNNNNERLASLDFSPTVNVNNFYLKFQKQDMTLKCQGLQISCKLFLPERFPHRKYSTLPDIVLIITSFHSTETMTFILHLLKKKRKQILGKKKKSWLFEFFVISCVMKHVLVPWLI